MSVKSKAELAQFDNEQSVVKWMSITDDNEQRRVLSQLCYMEYTDQIKTVINAGVSPNVHNHKPHQSASSFEDDKSLLRISIERRNWDVVQTLLECGADPKLARVDYVNPVGTRKRSRTKDSNLMRVIQMPFDDDTRKLAEMLLNKGSNLKAQNSETGNTCLHYSLEGPHQQWFDFLLNKFPEKVCDCINETDNSGYTVLGHAIVKYVIMSKKNRRQKAKVYHRFAVELLTLGQDIIDRNIVIPGKPEFENRAILVLLNELDTIFPQRNEICNEHYTDLVELISLFSKDENNLKLFTECGDTPVHYFASFGLTTLLKPCTDEQLKSINKNGWSVIHFAAETGSFDSVEYLLERVPETIYFESIEGQTPIDVAEQNEKWLCAEKMMSFYSEVESNNDTDDISLEFEFETASFRIVSKIKPKVKETCELEINNEVKLVEKEEVRKEKSVHFDVNEKPQSKIDSVIDQLKNRPQNEIIDTLLELILHQEQNIAELENEVSRQELDIAKLITDNNNVQK